MPDENIQIVIQDQIASSIDTKLQAIETSALGAMDALTRMQQAISKVDASAINKAAQQVGQQGAQFRSTTTNINAYSTAILRADGRLDSLTSKIQANTAAINAQAAALASYTPAAQAATAASNALSTAQNQTSSSSVAGVGNLRAVSSELQVLRGNLQGSTRAAGYFLLQLGGMSEIVQAAFPVIGALALLAILGQMVIKVAELIGNWGDLRKIQDEALKAALDYQQQQIDISQQMLESSRKIVVAQAQLNAGGTGRGATTAGRAAGFNLDTSRAKQQLATLDDQITALKANIQDLQKTASQTTSGGIPSLFNGQNAANDAAKVAQATLPKYQEQLQTLQNQRNAAAQEQRASELENQVATANERQAGFKEAQSQFLTNAAEMLALRKAQNQLNLYEERSYWYSLIDAAKVYPQAYKQMLVTIGNLSQEIDKQRSEKAKEYQKQAADQANKDFKQLEEQAEIAQKLNDEANNLGPAWERYNAAVRAGQDIANQNSANLNITNIRFGEQQGVISKATAAWLIYQQQLKLVNAELQDIQTQAAKVSSDTKLTPAQRAGELQELGNKASQLQGQKDILNAQNQNTRNPQTQSPLDQIFGTGQGGFAQQIQATYQPIQELQSTFTTAFKSIEDGAAQSIGHAIVYATNLGDALKNVAHEGLESIISGLIKLGLQWVTMQALQAIIGTTAVSATATQAAAAATAWAPAAIAASIATFGSADAIGTAAYTSSLVSAQILTTGLANAGRYVTGGFVFGRGTGQSDNLTALLSPGEYVMPANSTAQYLPELNAMRSGVYNQNGSTQRPMSVTVHTDQQTGVQVQPVTHDEVHIIATQVANQVVTSQAPRAVANDLQNGNGHVTQALNRTMFIQRRTN
jgi:hypothetical protein